MITQEQTIEGGRKSWLAKVEKYGKEGAKEMMRRIGAKGGHAKKLKVESVGTENKVKINGK